MNIIYNKVVGTQEEKPNTVDTTSSLSIVYLRKNIEQITIVDEHGDYKAWQYDEATLTHNEYEQYISELIEGITPYTATQTAYYGESEKIFYGVPQGNITVFWDNYNGDYAVERIADRIVVSFDTLTDNATISIMIQ